MIFETILTPLIFLIGSGFLTCHTLALRFLGRIQCKQEFRKRTFFYLFFLVVEKLFPKNKWESLFYLLNLTKIAFVTLFATAWGYYLLQKPGFEKMGTPLLLTLSTGLIVEFSANLLAKAYPLTLLRTSTLIASFFLFLAFPLSFLSLKIYQLLFLKKPNVSKKDSVKEKILEIVHESELSLFLDPLDRRMITSLASFRERIVREIMVPRIDVFCLSVDQTVHEAAQKFLLEGYSRIPVYKKTMDEIEGVLLYKDVVQYYFMSIEKKQSSPLETPLERLIKPVLYAPETKKISSLLQEIRTQQIHLAIVVNEYGGTEGIVTIEDILEELVGEIADEYDLIEEEKLYHPHPSGGWIIDPKMTILDIEKDLGIPIPQSPEYDTLGGFVLHKTGTIPEEGWKIHSDLFSLEVLSSSKRSLQKILLIPAKNIDE